MYVIRANNKDYVVSEHAQQRMLWRGITEIWVIKTLEQGTITSQPHNIDLYECQILDEEYDQLLIVQVVVNEDQLIIVSVIDDTLPKDE